MIHSFLGFELDEQLFELRYHGKPIATPTRVFGMIAYLLHHRDRLVSKDELVRELWQATVASDTAISQTVMLARKALRDEGGSQRIIKTVRGRGFRFIAEVNVAPPRESAVSSPASSVVSLSHAHSSTPQSSLIGRSAELQDLQHALAGADRGLGRLLLIEGEPGIGKTALVSDFAAQCAASGCEVHWGRAWEGGGAPPYWPFIQVLRGIAQSEGQAVIRSCMEQGAADIFGMIPEWSSEPGRASHASLDGNLQHVRFRTFDAMARFLRNLCGPAAADGGAVRRTRLVILEDLHAADEATIELVRFLFTELQGLRLLVVATLRPLELSANPALAQLAEALHETQRIRLDGLAREDVASLLAQRVGQPVTHEVLTTLHELSGGHPLLLGEMCRHVGRDGLTSFIDPSALSSMTPPERIASSIRKPLRDLPPETAAVLGVASALSCEFSIPLLAELCGISEVEVLDRLAPAINRGLVRQRAGSDQRVFSHVLVQRAVYADLPMNSRLQLHLRIAQLLEQRRHTAFPSRAPLFEIAHHYQQCAPLGYRQQALDYARRAAQQACDLTAFEVAASLYERALGLAETQGDAPALVHELLCDAGDAWVHAGRLMQATERYERAAATARAENRAEHFAYAVLRAANAMRSGFFHNLVRQSELQEALALLPDTDSEVRASALAMRAFGIRGEGRLAQRDAMTKEAVAMARRLGCERTLVGTLTLRYIALWGLAHPNLTLEIANELLEVASRPSSNDHLLDALLFRLFCHVELMNLPAIWQDMERYSCEVQRRRSPWHAYLEMIILASGASQQGDFVSSERHSTLALRHGLRMHDELAAAYHAIRDLFLQLDRGVRHLPASSDPPDFVPEEYHAFWALLWVRRGEYGRASQAMTRLLRQDWEHLVPGPLRRPLLAAVGEVCAALGERAYLERIYENLLPERGLTLALQAGVPLGPVSFYLGTVAAALGRHEDAEAHLREALEVEVSPPGPWRLRTLHRYGELLAVHDPRRARSILLEAKEGADRLGMRDLSDDIQQALDQGTAALSGREVVAESLIRSPAPRAVVVPPPRAASGGLRAPLRAAEAAISLRAQAPGRRRRSASRARRP